MLPISLTTQTSHDVVEPPDLFNSVRITLIKSVTATVNEEMETIAMEAALATVQARRIKSKKTLHHRRAIYHVTWDMAIQGIPSPQATNNNFYGNHLQNVPANYVKEIQYGEFLNWPSMLLPKIIPCWMSENL